MGQIMINAIFTVLGLAMTAAAVYLGYRIVTYYRSTTGTRRERLLASAKYSETILLQFFYFIGGWFIAVAGFASEAVGLPDVRQFLNDNVGPAVLGCVVAALAVFTMWARLYRMGQRYPAPGPNQG